MFVQATRGLHQNLTCQCAQLQAKVLHLCWCRLCVYVTGNICLLALLITPMLWKAKHWNWSAVNILTTSSGANGQKNGQLWECPSNPKTDNEWHNSRSTFQSEVCAAGIRDVQYAGATHWQKEELRCEKKENLWQVYQAYWNNIMLYTVGTTMFLSAYTANTEIWRNVLICFPL